MAAFGTTFRPLHLSGYRTGALDISLPDRRIISIPTQLGCPVACTFCVSRHTPLVRSLTSAEMLTLVQLCLEASPADGRPIELSFTGEGEAVLNFRETRVVCYRIGSLSRDFDSVRYCFSGLGASKLLQRLESGPYRMRLQLSLHAARQVTRDAMIPLSEPLWLVQATMREFEAHFSSIELNVVLQDGVNDSGADLAALAAWGENRWPILLNPLLGAEVAQIATRTDVFEDYLLASGRTVKRYSRIAQNISQLGIYPQITAARAPKATPLVFTPNWRDDVTDVMPLDNLDINWCK